MHIRDIFARDTTTFSFEFFPPKSDQAWGALFERISDFEALGPSFVSVTYGAGGSTREQTHDLVVRLHRETGLDPVPHLTCVCHKRAEIAAILERYCEAGISNILALHGDPPRGMTDYDRSKDDFRYAIDSTITRETLGWQPAVGFDEGLELTVRWYVERPGWWQALMAAES